MKAAVLHKIGETPKYEDFADPVPGKDEVLITVKAVALENIDKMIAAGKHYSSKQFMAHMPAIVGFDGIGTLEDGTLVGFGGTTAPYGAMAEKTVVPKTHIVPIPEGIDAATATAYPSALTAFAMKSAAGFKPGETVLVNGATGVAGKLTVQVAKLLGAGRVVGTGRNAEELKEVIALGADSVVNTSESDEAVQAAFKKEAGKSGYDVILDFLWGRPTELLIKTLVPDELRAEKPVRLVQIGEAAGPTISVSADSLRTSGLEIYGAGKGITGEAMMEATEQVTQWVREGKITFAIEQVPLKDIESAWQRTDFKGKRLVVVP